VVNYNPDRIMEELKFRNVKLGRGYEFFERDNNTVESTSGTA
jgi:hypothetical protein